MQRAALTLRTRRRVARVPGTQVSTGRIPLLSPDTAPFCSSYRYRARGSRRHGKARASAAAKLHFVAPAQEFPLRFIVQPQCGSFFWQELDLGSSPDQLPLLSFVQKTPQSRRELWLSFSLQVVEPRQGVANNLQEATCIRGTSPLTARYSNRSRLFSVICVCRKLWLSHRAVTGCDNTGLGLIESASPADTFQGTSMHSLFGKHRAIVSASPTVEEYADA